MELYVKEIFPITLLFILIFIVPLFYLGRNHPRRIDIPRTITIASVVEAIFGILIIIYSVGAMLRLYPSPTDVISPEYIFLMGFSISMIWLIMASQLSKGGIHARRMCLVMSLLRILSVYGIIFSAVTMYLLYFHRNSNDFYGKSIL